MWVCILCIKSVNVTISRQYTIILHMMYHRFHLEKPKPTIKRRSHYKSRRGCLSCKHARVKCDEVHPVCRRCCRQQTNCVYQISQISQNQLSTLQSVDIDSAGTPTAHLMQNFAHCIDVSFASPIGKSIFYQFVLPRSASRPFLLHSLLSFSARHLHHLQPSRSHQMASLFHAQKAARLVNEQLDHVGPHNISHLYAACLVINMTAFSDDSPSWIFQSDPAAFNWFLIQQGLCHLSSILKQHLPHSFWQIKHDAITSSNTPSHTLSSHLSSHPLFIDSSLSPQMQDLFETHPDSPYYVPLQLLAHFHRNPSDTDSLLSFGPRILPSFRLLLLQKDPRSLFLFHLWLQLLGRSSCWWIAGRVSRESAALILQLSHIPSSPNLEKGEM